MVLGVTLFLFAYVALAVSGVSIPLLLTGFVLAGVGIGAVETAEHAAIAKHAPERIRGSAFGVLAAMQSAGNLVASAGAGILWTLVGGGWAFAVAAMWMGIALAILINPLRRERAGC